MPKDTEQQLTGSEQLRNCITTAELQHRITTAAYLTGGSVAMWVIPIGLLFVEAPRGVYVLASGLATSLSVGTFLLGLVFRAQHYNAAMREQAEALAKRRHDELIGQIEQVRIEATRWHTHLLHQIGQDHTALHRHLAALAKSVDRITLQVSQDYFNIYGDVAADLVGGQDVVDGTVTKPLNGHVSNGKVVPLPKAHNGRS
jgi:hypothetical protein